MIERARHIKEFSELPPRAGKRLLTEVYKFYVNLMVIAVE